jgi:hypothetical protein
VTAPLIAVAVGIAPAGPGRAGLARSVGIVRRRRTPGLADPLVLDHLLEVRAALEILGSLGQGIAFVSVDGRATGVVTADDLDFAGDWAGPRATVADAVTQRLVDLAPNEAITPGSWQGRVSL